MLNPQRVRLPRPERDASASARAATRWSPMISIFQAASRTQLDDVRALMRAFVAWHRAHHAADIALIERYFDAAAFAAELAGLPGDYAPPAGRLLIAYRGGTPGGCVALRGLGDGDCKMARMFVPVAMRGHGIGRALAERLLGEAKLAGYRRMRLETSWRQAAAIGLYESLGFRRSESYFELPPELRDWLVFYEREL